VLAAGGGEAERAYKGHKITISMCAKNHLLIFSSFLDIWENVEWPRFFGPPGIRQYDKDITYM